MTRDSEKTPSEARADKTEEPPQNVWRLYDFAEDCLIPRKPESDKDDGMSWAAE
ncbi:hypothetical protein [Oceanicola sp. 22II-s10i]|uniref:hypothetical protein n=1 Tax=Oceanicola sp. 22II-s10i TaxID=1317116 RepID=UPI0015951DFB|nr:hypothetical protein [Oceanicola sp. 22II-s10i]